MKKWHLLLVLFCISITTQQLFSFDDDVEDYSHLLHNGTANYGDMRFPFTVLSQQVLVNDDDPDNLIHFTIGQVIARNGDLYYIRLTNSGWRFCNVNGTALDNEPDAALFDFSMKAYSVDFLQNNKRTVVIGGSTIAALVTAYGTNWYNKKKGTHISPYKTAAVAWVTTAALIIGGYYITSPVGEDLLID